MRGSYHKESTPLPRDNTHPNIPISPPSPNVNSSIDKRKSSPFQTKNKIKGKGKKGFLSLLQDSTFPLSINKRYYVIPKEEEGVLHYLMSDFNTLDEFISSLENRSVEMISSMRLMNKSMLNYAEFSAQHIKYTTENQSLGMKYLNSVNDFTSHTNQFEQTLHQFLDREIEKLREEAQNIQAKIETRDHNINEFDRRCRDHAKHREEKVKEIKIQRKRNEEERSKLIHLKKEQDQDAGIQNLLLTRDAKDKGPVEKHEMVDNEDEVEGYIEENNNEGSKESLSSEIYLELNACNDGQINKGITTSTQITQDAGIQKGVKHPEKGQHKDKKIIYKFLESEEDFYQRVKEQEEKILADLQQEEETLKGIDSILDELTQDLKGALVGFSRRKSILLTQFLMTVGPSQRLVFDKLNTGLTNFFNDETFPSLTITSHKEELEENIDNSVKISNTKRKSFSEMFPPIVIEYERNDIPGADVGYSKSNRNSVNITGDSSSNFNHEKEKKANASGGLGFGLKLKNMLSDSTISRSFAEKEKIKRTKNENNTDEISSESAGWESIEEEFQNAVDKTYRTQEQKILETNSKKSFFSNPDLSFSSFRQLMNPNFGRDDYTSSNLNTNNNPNFYSKVDHEIFNRKLGDQNNVVRKVFDLDYENSRYDKLLIEQEKDILERFLIRDVESERQDNQNNLSVVEDAYDRRNIPSNDMLRFILGSSSRYLDVVDYAHVSSTCRTWNNMLREDISSTMSKIPLFPQSTPYENPSVSLALQSTPTYLNLWKQCVMRYGVPEKYRARFWYYYLYGKISWNELSNVLSSVEFNDLKDSNENIKEDERKTLNFSPDMTVLSQNAAQDTIIGLETKAQESVEEENTNLYKRLLKSAYDQVFHFEKFGTLPQSVEYEDDCTISRSTSSQHDTELDEDTVDENENESNSNILDGQRRSNWIIEIDVDVKRTYGLEKGYDMQTPSKYDFYNIIMRNADPYNQDVRGSMVGGQGRRDSSLSKEKVIDESNERSNTHLRSSIDLSLLNEHASNSTFEDDEDDEDEEEEEIMETDSHRTDDKQSLNSSFEIIDVEKNISNSTNKPLESDSIVLQEMSEKEIQRMRLKRVLWVYALYDKKIRYCQGMNMVAALLLNVTQNNEELAFTLLVGLVKKFGLSEMWSNDMPRLKLCFFVFEKLLKVRLPMLHAHFEEQGLHVGMFSSKWFVTLFANLDTLPLMTVLKIWDVFMLEKWSHVFAVATTIIEILQDKLISSNLEDILQIMRDPRPTLSEIMQRDRNLISGVSNTSEFESSEIKDSYTDTDSVSTISSINDDEDSSNIVNLDNDEKSWNYTDNNLEKQTSDGNRSQSLDYVKRGSVDEQIMSKLLLRRTSIVTVSDLIYKEIEIKYNV